MKKILLLACMLTVTACAKPVQKVMQPSGGSKADGIIELSYQYDTIFESPQVDSELSIKTAQERCKLWGFKSSEPFANITFKCLSMANNGTCYLQQVTQKFQCLD